MDALSTNAASVDAPGSASRHVVPLVGKIVAALAAPGQANPQNLDLIARLQMQRPLIEVDPNQIAFRT
jgi:hypothetical protein